MVERRRHGRWRMADEMRGTPQGSVVSPILANIYLHYVLDLWFQKKWRVREAEGDTIIVRYADDFVVGFQHKADAERFLTDLKERLASFELSLHPDKTPAHRVWRVRASESPSAWAGPTGDVRFSGFHALLCAGSERTFSGGAQAGGQACDAHAETDQGGASQADARQRRSNRAMAGTSPQWMAELLCRPDQLPVSEAFRPPAEAAMAPGFTPPLPEGPLWLGRLGETGR